MYPCGLFHLNGRIKWSTMQCCFHCQIQLRLKIAVGMPSDSFEQWTECFSGLRGQTVFVATGILTAVYFYNENDTLRQLLTTRNTQSFSLIPSQQAEPIRNDTGNVPAAILCLDAYAVFTRFLVKQPWHPESQVVEDTCANGFSCYQTEFREQGYRKGAFILR